MGLENGENKENNPIIGKRFGMLTVLSIHKQNTRLMCSCVCDCGTCRDVRKDHLLAGKTVSCGCYGKNLKNGTTHGMSGTRLHRIWKGMINRCRCGDNPGFINYAGRGISVCDEWKKFEPFYEWAMANGYREDLTIDRIDVNGNYEPSNCRWATVQEQALNRRSNVFITFNGATKHISEWDKEIGASKSGRIRARLNAGWSVEKALTTPVARRDLYQR